MVGLRDGRTAATFVLAAGVALLVVGAAVPASSPGVAAQVLRAGNAISEGLHDMVRAKGALHCEVLHGAGSVGVAVYRGDWRAFQGTGFVLEVSGTGLEPGRILPGLPTF